MAKLRSALLRVVALKKPNLCYLGRGKESWGEEVESSWWLASRLGTCVCLARKSWPSFIPFDGRGKSPTCRTESTTRLSSLTRPCSPVRFIHLVSPAPWGSTTSHTGRRRSPRPRPAPQPCTHSSLSNLLRLRDRNRQQGQRYSRAYKEWG